MLWPRHPPQVFVSNPDVIKQVFTGDPAVFHAGEGNGFLAPVLGRHSLLLLDREVHLRQRRLLLPPFHGERMHSYAMIMRDIADRTLDSWALGSHFGMVPQMRAITLEIIVRTVFGIEEGPRLARFARLLGDFMDVANTPLLFAPFLQHDLGPHSPWGRVAARVRGVATELRTEIARRRAAGTGGRQDILSLMLEARDESGEPMSDDEIHDELVTLLAAGHETTATAMGWAFAEILSRPQVLQTIDNELQTTMGNGPLLPEHLPSLVYLDAVIREVLRLRSILLVVARLLKAPVTLGGYTLPAGVMVMPCIYLAHRRTDSYPEPHEFRPDRFLSSKPDPYRWLPFGGGVRRCIGMAFALYEMKVVLATILSRSQLLLAPGHKIRPVRRGITLAPAEGLKVVLQSRRPRPPLRTSFHPL